MGMASLGTTHLKVVVLSLAKFFEIIYANFRGSTYSFLCSLLQHFFSFFSTHKVEDVWCNQFFSLWSSLKSASTLFNLFFKTSFVPLTHYVLFLKLIRETCRLLKYNVFNHFKSPSFLC